MRNGKITIHEVEPGKGLDRCAAGAVQVLFHESKTRPDKPNMAYLTELFKTNGLQARAGEPVKDAPLLRLCVSRQGEQGRECLTVGDVENVLRSDPDAVDLDQAQIRRERLEPKAEGPP